MTTRSPGRTSTLEGTNVMSRAATFTRTVSPVADTADGGGATAATPAAAGSSPTPMLSAMASAATPATRPSPVKALRRSARSAAGSPAAARRRSATDARMPRTMIGMKAANAARTSTETVTLTQPLSGATQATSPPLMTTSRTVANRSNSAAPARTTRGPPPSTDGSR
jgi:hypothetical protein